MFGGAMGFGCLVELWVLDIWWSYGTISALSLLSTLLFLENQTSKAHSSTKHPNPIAPPNIQNP
jgi:hypothetical protein